MQLENIIFKDRDDATNRLIEVLPINDMRQENWIVIATSAGSVPIALKISKVLDADFDFLFTQKIFTPKNSECEIAIISETGEIVIHEELMKSFSLKLDEIYNEINIKYDNEVMEYKAKYRDSLDIINLENKNVLLIDEGLNTGLTMMSCIKSVINKKAKSICVAVPVLPEVTVHDIETIADDLYFVEAPAHFVSIDFYYESLEKINLEDIKILKGK
ncbi:MAG: phosphoribosyltransferase family protein [Campylobacterota bacterium]|nr:phosphoribosyltransferase family protein [Campylobacterota bacterium]